MDDTLSTRDQLARDLYVHNADMQPDVAFQAADAFMAERAKRTPVAAVADTACTEAISNGTATRMPGECAASVTLCGAPVVLDPTMKGDDYRFEPSPAPPAAPAIVFSLAEHLRRQHEWSERTFGPGPRTAGVIDHIRKELGEIEAQPNDLEEWIDVVILALDGAWRSGASPEQIITALTAKQAKNELRTWPDWRTAEQGKAIEHIRKVTP